MAKSSKRASPIAKTAKTTAKKPPVTKTATARVGQPKYSDSAKITILEKGKENPRRKEGGPYKRYAVLLKSKTVGQFLKELPEWRATINRAVKEGRVSVKE